MGSLNNFCRRKFFRLGFCVGKYPKLFIFTPLIVLLVLACGIFNLKYTDDVLALNSVKNGVTFLDRERLLKLFPRNSTMRFTPSRQLYMGRYVSLFIIRKDGDSIINPETWTEIMEVDETLRNISIKWQDESYNYSQLCATWNGACVQNEHLEIGGLLNRIETGSVRLSYPVMFNPVTFQTYAMNQLFGGVQLLNGSSNTVKSAKLIMLNYYIRDDTEEDDLLGINWETAVIDHLESLNKRLKISKVIYAASISVTREPEKVAMTTLPYFTLSVILMTIFIVFSSLTGDMVTSKPWVCVLGMVSANFGTLSALGIVCYLGIPYLGLLNSVPFIALGVGVDDTFVMLAAWWKTSRKDSVPQRMAHCYSEAGVSITITSLTDILCFYVGVLSPISSIQVFCFYAGTTVMSIYLWHLFFFGGILALSGYGEEEQRHSLYFWRKTDIVPSDTKDNGWETSKANAVMEKCSSTLSSFLENKKSQFFIIVIYILYIGIFFWGLIHLKEGMAKKDTALRSSHLSEYFDTFDAYFREFPHRYQVVITSSPPLDYSKLETQNKVLNIVKNITHINRMTPEYMENWLSDYLRFLDNYKEFYDFNVTNEQDFISSLRTYYLQDTSHFSEDIIFSENFTHIEAARFIVSSHNVEDQEADTQLLIDLHNFANSVKDVNVTIYNRGNIVDDINLILMSMTLKLLSIATVIVMIITFAFIPSISSTVFIFLSIASIELGVFGFMSLWGVHLDNVSIITLIMCIGFSIDFPLHIYYAYVSSTFDTAEEKIRDTLLSLGLPILQGAFSTIIAVSGLYFIDSYITAVFFKVVILVMIFAVFISLFVLPVTLLIVKPKSNSLFSKTKSYIIKM